MSKDVRYVSHFLAEKYRNTPKLTCHAWNILKYL